MLIVSHDVIHLMEGIVVEIYLWFLVDKLFLLDLLLKNWQQMITTCQPTTINKQIL